MPWLIVLFLNFINGPFKQFHTLLLVKWNNSQLRLYIIIFFTRDGISIFWGSSLLS